MMPFGMAAVLFALAPGIRGEEAADASRDARIEERMTNLEALMNHSAPAAVHRASRVRVNAGDHAWLLIGLLAGATCCFAVTKLKAAFGDDDSLDAFGVHGLGGTLGALLTGIFADPEVNPALASTWKAHGATVALAGGFGQFLHQLKAAAFTWALAIGATFLILKATNAFVGLRVSDEDETLGLDLSQHGKGACNT